MIPARPYEPHAYDTAWPDSHWRRAHPAPPAPPVLTGAQRAEVAVIGAGYAGLNAALRLAARGAEVAVLDAARPGWGASGRNGGFCCLGGAKLSGAAIVRAVGRDGAREWRAFQHAAVAHVAGLLDALGIDARQGPEGEVRLAHSPRAFAAMRAEAGAAPSGEAGELVPAAALAERGLAGPGFHGAEIGRAGFPLDPMTYVEGLAQAVAAAGARIYGESPVTALAAEGGGWRLTTPGGVLTARKVLVATNGYSSDALPRWLGGRFLPVLSSILVTRPLTAAERAAQGFTTPLMAYDSRELLHYFRHLPDGRFLFGMRGGASAAPAALAATQRRVRAHFEALFPAWRGAETETSWSGLACLTGSLAPFTGPVPGAEGLFAAFGWHGNGVGPASCGGHLAAGLMLGEAAPVPALLARPPRRIPLPRRMALAAAYAVFAVKDGRLPRG